MRARPLVLGLVLSAGALTLALGTGVSSETETGVELYRASAESVDTESSRVESSRTSSMNSESTVKIESAAGLPPRATAGDFMRGMVVSCPRAGQIWGSPKMTEALRAIRPLGVEWISIHPYARVRRDGSIRNWFPTESGYLPEAAKRIRDEKMSIFWKPHLAYWGSFSWRGEIEFGDDSAAWKRFFEDYRAFIVDQAKFAETHGVPLLAVGVELDRTLHFEREWRQIIAEIRTVYRGEILYAANWDSVERVPFWDALDAIGVHAYFPLASGPEVQREQIRSSWRQHLKALESLSKRQGDKPVVLAEIGYTRSVKAASEPWAYGTEDTPDNRSRRRLLIEVAIEEIEKSPTIAGMFWWKWIPGDHRWDPDFSMKDPEAVAVLSELWGKEAPGTSR